ncbi:MAG: NF038143 family protein [Deltaproteobacteria bacterium]|nr:NF038143 family protein [Deltaproteobacteria bacterium]
MEKLDIIRAAETQFAREVTIGVVYQQPPSAWYYLIPGMFIIDFLRRTTAISRYTKHFMFPRNLALDAARALSSGEEKALIDRNLDGDIKQWLQSLNLYSTGLARSQRAAVDLLTDHYTRLFNAQGATYYELIENAYPAQAAFENHLAALTDAENEIDRVIIAQAGNNEKLKEKLDLEAQQVAKRRNRTVEDIY